MSNTIAGANQTRHGGFQLSTAFECQLTTGQARECEPKAQHVAWNHVHPTVIYSVPVGYMWTNRVTLAATDRAVGFPTRGLYSWNCEGFRWFPRLAREE